MNIFVIIYLVCGTAHNLAAGVYFCDILFGFARHAAPTTKKETKTKIKCRRLCFCLRDISEFTLSSVVYVHTQIMTFLFSRPFYLQQQ